MGKVLLPETGGFTTNLKLLFVLILKLSYNHYIFILISLLSRICNYTQYWTNLLLLKTIFPAHSKNNENFNLLSILY